ncbi:ist1-like protein [Phtheirospermum japonicum]|uniref:Ist1-like protein n=1 Tax=Phtheirospermum japonicum TaxID=374723 RepID=A0A830BBY2_9LAMI|nr:ist1-like protein [Phtheirospermum japonicum]
MFSTYTHLSISTTAKAAICQPLAPLPHPASAPHDGKTEEFLAGKDLLSCYDFVEQSCEYTLKQLSRMQKQGECLEECREAVASLMYAAARFSDLPELRELRDIFQQRYGNRLEAFVNQKFVEKLSLRPPASERRLQVLQEIASEFSIKWDSRGFERRMATPSAAAQKLRSERNERGNRRRTLLLLPAARPPSLQRSPSTAADFISTVDTQKVDIAKPRHGLLEGKKSRIRDCGEDNTLANHCFSEWKETIEYREKSVLRAGGSSLHGDGGELSSRGRHTVTESKLSYPFEKVDAELKVERSDVSSHGKIFENNVHSGYINGICNPRKGEREALFCEKAEFSRSYLKPVGRTENVTSSNYSNKDNVLNTTRKGVEDGSDRLKSCLSYALPPPYVKLKDSTPRPPYIKPKEDKHRHGRGSTHASSYQLDGHSIDAGCEDHLVAPAKVKNDDPEKDLEKISLPKPRSIRRKHHKSPTSYNLVDALEEDVGAVVSRSASSGRKDHSRKGLQILFEEEHHRKDDEERMIDQLLIHYCKKSSSNDDGKLRKKSCRQINGNVGESSLDDGDVKSEGFTHPTRSVSLPHEQPTSPQPKKFFTRANTLQPDHNQARHVHPKLPDYDDLAARFAALKGR